MSSRIPRGTLPAPRVSVPPPMLTGDFNIDCVVDANDIDVLVAEIIANSTDQLFDLNADGLVDIRDHSTMILDVIQTSFADANLDGAVDFSDFLIVARSFGEAGGWASGRSECGK